MIDRDWLLKWEKKRKDSDRRWHVGEAIGLVVVAGLFTLLGGLLSRGL